ncbi:hypothetical protein BDC45DRAFT_508504 [Circinella umbellata]|nr:hypothetical protein BDC45DRAFT_508504 [Circinella umbellata]
MTVKSPFYNKPSTATSVDSCHKCPLDFTTQPKDSNVVPVSISVNEAQISHSGIEQLQVTTDRSNSNINNVAEPCSSSAAKSDIGNVSVTSCSNCGTTTTPLWRRSPKGETICNACGLYLKARNTTRPPWLKRNSTKRPIPSIPVALAPAPSTSAPIVSRISPVPIQQQQIIVDKMINAPSPTSSTTSMCDKCTDDCTENNCQRSSLSCANCNTTTTPLWRRDAQGNTICNACGLYYKLHNVHRPMTMKRSIIKRRKRVTVSSLAAQQNGYSCSSSSDESDIDGRKRKASSHDDYRPAKRVMELPVLAAKYPMRPLLPHQPSSPPTIIAPKPHLSASVPPSSSTQIEARLDPVEPDAFQKRPMHLPSPPMKPVSNIAQLLNPDKESKSRCSLPSISLPSLPSPPLTAHEMFKEPTSPGAVKQQQERPKQDNNRNSNNQNSSAVAAAAALATVSALLNPTVNPQQTHQMLEAHRHELQREVTNLTSLLTRTTAMLQNLDQVMAVAGTVDQQKNSGVANALMSLFALANNNNKNNNKEDHMPLTPPSDHHHHHQQRRSMDARV